MGWTCKSIQEVRDNPPSQHPFCSLPGVTSKNVAHDVLHVLLTKGVLAHLLGGVLHALVYEGPGRQATPPSERLAVIFDLIQKFYKENNTSTRLVNLKLSMFLADVGSPHANRPFLGTKGGETKHLLPAILWVLRKLNDSSEYHLRMIACMKAIHTFIQILDEADFVPTSVQADLLEEKCFAFLGHYAWLNHFAESQNTLLFHIVPKFHMLCHLALSARYLNPRVHWCFKAEDFVGKISKCALSVACGSKSTKHSVKLATKYRYLLHFRLTRGDAE